MYVILLLKQVRQLLLPGREEKEERAKGGSSEE